MMNTKWQFNDIFIILYPNVGSHFDRRVTKAISMLRKLMNDTAQSAQLITFDALMMWNLILSIFAHSLLVVLLRLRLSYLSVLSHGKHTTNATILKFIAYYYYYAMLRAIKTTITAYTVFVYALKSLNAKFVNKITYFDYESWWKRHVTLVRVQAPLLYHTPHIRGGRACVCVCATVSEMVKHAITAAARLSVSQQISDNLENFAFCM